MDALLRKLNHKPPAPVTVLGAPPEVGPVLDRWREEVEVRERLRRDEGFVLAFVRSQAEIGEQAKP